MGNTPSVIHFQLICSTTKFGSSIRDALLFERKNYENIVSTPIFYAFYSLHLHICSPSSSSAAGAAGAAAGPAHDSRLNALGKWKMQMCPDPARCVHGAARCFRAHSAAGTFGSDEPIIPINSSRICPIVVHSHPKATKFCSSSSDVFQTVKTIVKNSVLNTPCFSTPDYSYSHL
jgi:hypothetical protein